MADLMEEEPQGPITREAQDNYRVFKKNSPFFYDYISTHTLLWPSLSVQFLPDLEVTLESSLSAVATDLGAAASSQVAYQRLLFGTFTLGQATDAIHIQQLAYYRNLNRCINTETWRYGPEKQEFELPAISKTPLRLLQTINHHGDVNRLRYMPQNPDVVASSNNFGNLLVYNRTKHSTIKKIGQELDINEPQICLGGGSSSAQTDIFAFDWCRVSEGRIASASMDGQICVYDIRRDYEKRSKNRIEPFWLLLVEVGVNDLEWVPVHDSLFVTADDLGLMSLYDVRAGQTSQKTSKTQNALNSVGLNPNSEFSLATGDSHGSIAVWDLREMLQSIVEFRPHSDSITQVKWHPKYASVLGSSSTDHLVKLHDFSIELDFLLFSHSGHMLGVNDFDWSLHEDFMLTSVADDNTLHVWRPASNLLRR